MDEFGSDPENRGLRARLVGVLETGRAVLVEVGTDAAADLVDRLSSDEWTRRFERGFSAVGLAGVGLAAVGVLGRLLLDRREDDETGETADEEGSAAGTTGDESADAGTGSEDAASPGGDGTGEPADEPGGPAPDDPGTDRPSRVRTGAERDRTSAAGGEGDAERDDTADGEGGTRTGTGPDDREDDEDTEESSGRLPSLPRPSVPGPAPPQPSITVHRPGSDGESNDGPRISPVVGVTALVGIRLVVERLQDEDG